jgi:hypothetical protein
MNMQSSRKAVFLAIPYSVEMNSNVLMYFEENGYMKNEIGSRETQKY